jgi:hypothetical protein
LPGPGEQGGEEHEDAQADTNHEQRAFGAVDDDFIDDDLGEQGGTEGEQLDDQGGDQDVAPDAAVFEQFGDEPAEAEVLIAFLGAVGVADGLAGQGELEGGAGEHAFEFGVGQGLGGVAAGFEQDDVLFVDLDDDGGAGCRRRRAIVGGGIGVGFLFGLDHDQAGEIQGGDFFAVAIDAFDTKAEGAGGVDEGVGAIRRRELLDQQVAVEGLAVQGAEAAHRPDDVVDGKYMLRRARSRSPRGTRAQDVPSH